MLIDGVVMIQVESCNTNNESHPIVPANGKSSIESSRRLVITSPHSGHYCSTDRQSVLFSTNNFENRIARSSSPGTSKVLIFERILATCSSK